MRKLISVSLCLLVASTGCHSTKSPPDRYTYAKVVDTRRQTQEHPDRAVVDDQDTTITGDEVVGTAALAFAAVVAPFVFVYEQIDEARGNTPSKAAREMNDASATPDTHRDGIMNLVTRWAFTHRAPYTTRYRQIAEQDPNDTVRAMAIRALNISRDRTAVPVFIAALEDGSELVRLEAVKALGNIPDTAAIPGLIRRLQGKRDVTINGRADSLDESKDVRIAAADALRRYRNLDVARVLVSQLGERDFGIAWQSNRSLTSLTRQDFGYDESAWLQYLTSRDKPFG